MSRTQHYYIIGEKRNLKTKVMPEADNKPIASKVYKNINESKLEFLF